MKGIKIMTSDNIISHLARVQVLADQTSKAGKKYSVLVLTWILPNEKTYEQRVFLTNEQLAVITMTSAKEALL